MSFHLEELFVEFVSSVSCILSPFAPHSILYILDHTVVSSHSLRFFAASLDDVKRWELFLRILLVPQLDVRIVRVTFLT